MLTEQAPLEREPSPVAVTDPPYEGTREVDAEPEPEYPREILYRGAYFSAQPFLYVRLWGVSADGKTAWVSYSDTSRVPRTDDLQWGVDEIDLEAGHLRERWKETVGSADPKAYSTFGMHWPLVDDGQDLARVAQIAVKAGNPVLGPQLAVSPDGTKVLHHRYGDDRAAGDWLILREVATGKRIARFDKGMLASYAPAFSPDGERVAFTATKPGNGAEGAGPYAVYVQEMATGRRIELPELGHARAIWWDPRGREVWTVASNRDQRHCLRRFELASKTLSDVACPPEAVRDVRAVVSDDRRHAVIWGYFGEPGQQRSVLLPVDLETGEIGAQGELELGTNVLAVRNDGLVLGHRQGATVFWDLERDEIRSVESGFGGGIRWMDDGSVVMARTQPDGQGKTTITIERVWPGRLPLAR
jgi:hypothetical protein